MVLLSFLLPKPIYSTLVAGVGVFALIWVLSRLALGPGPYNMDPKDVPGTFEPHLKRYQDIAKFLLTLSAATVAFLFNFLVNSAPADKGRGRYAGALEAASPWAISFLCFSAFCALVFLLGQTYIYEGYCHSTNRDNYTGSLYAAQVAFGWSSLVWFLAAYAYLAYRVLS